MIVIYDCFVEKLKKNYLIPVTPLTHAATEATLANTEGNIGLPQVTPNDATPITIFW